LVALALMATAASGAACDDDEGTRPDASVRPDGGGVDGSTDRAPTPDVAQPDGRDGPASEGGASEGGASEGGQGEAGGGDGPGDAPAALTEQEQRGKYLVENVIACPECHTPRLMDGSLDMSKYMAGSTECFAKLPNNDCIYPKNLTPHATGLGNRTAAEIKTMISEGMRPEAAPDRPLHPIMPYYVFGNTDPDDLDAIVAFLRTLTPVAQEIPAKGAGWSIPEPADPINLGNVPEPEATYENQAAASRGRYLAAQVGLCVECHTKHLMGAATVLDETKMFQGGEEFPLTFGSLMVTARSKNLTPHMTSGLGTWTVEDIIKALKQGKDKMDKGICPPMPAGPMSSYGGLTNQDARDIAHYLKSIAPVDNMVLDMCSFPPGT
jgi:mono/diheme cytochrome c family protein